jgi:hypothetical protein
LVQVQFFVNSLPIAIIYFGIGYAKLEKEVY